MRRTLLLVLSLCLFACGPNPRFAGGPTACANRCEDEGMQMGAFVYMGDWSSGCVCEPSAASAQSAGGEAPHSAALAGGTAVTLLLALQQQQQQTAARR